MKLKIGPLGQDFYSIDYLFIIYWDSNLNMNYHLIKIFLLFCFCVIFFFFCVFCLDCFLSCDIEHIHETNLFENEQEEEKEKIHLVEYLSALLKMPEVLKSIKAIALTEYKLHHLYIQFQSFLC